MSWPLAWLVRSLFLFTLSVSVGLITAQTSFAGITLPQANGETLSLPLPAERIITLAPNLAELVFAAGAGEQLKAVVEYSNFPAQVKQIPRIGDAFRIDLERIIELEPDLVIAWKSGNPDFISHAAGTQAIGQTVARLSGDKLTKLRHQNADKSPVDYFYQIAPRPLYTINGQHIISRSLEVCGGVNIFSELPTLAPQISRESVIVANPRAMIAPEISGDPPALAVWQDWPRLQAVQNKTMLYLPADEISQATPRLLDSIDLACKLLDEVRGVTQQVEDK